jgi:hypothetical protein
LLQHKAVLLQHKLFSDKRENNGSFETLNPSAEQKERRQILCLPVLLAWLILAALAGPGLQRLQVDTSTDSVLDRQHPAWQAYQASQDDFGGDEIIVIALGGTRPFDPEVLSAAARLGESLENLEGVRRVDSIARVPGVCVNAEGDLELEPALDEEIADPQARAERVARRLAQDRIAPRSLIADDGRVIALNLVLERGSEARHAELLEEVHAQVDPVGGILSGVPVFRVAATARTRAEGTPTPRTPRCGTRRNITT